MKTIAIKIVIKERWMGKKCDYGYQYSSEPRNTDLNPNLPHP